MIKIIGILIVMGAIPAVLCALPISRMTLLFIGFWIGAFYQYHNDFNRTR